MAEEPLPVEDEPAPPADLDASSEEPTSTEEPAVEAAPETETEAETPSDEAPTSTIDPADAEDVDFAFAKIGIDRVAFNKLPPESQKAFVALAKQYRETNNRAGEFARQAKEAAARARPPEAPDTAAIPPPAPPRGNELEQVVAEELNRAVSQDRLCQTWRTEYLKNEELNNEAATKLGNLDYQISRLEANLDTETLKKMGIESPYDEYQQRNMKDLLHDLKQQKRELLYDSDARTARNQKLDAAWKERVGQGRKSIMERYEAASREEEERQEINAVATSFQKEWKAGLVKAWIDLKVPNDPELRRTLDLRARMAARAAVGQAPIEDGKVAEFLINAIREDLAAGKLLVKHRMIQYAKDKLADATSPAPPGQAAVAKPVSNPDDPNAWKKDFERKKAALFKQHPALERLG